MKMVPSPLLILLQSRLLRPPITSRSRLPNLLSARLEETLSQLGMLQLLLLWSMPGLQELVSARVLLPLSAMKMVPSPLLILLQSRLLRLPITLRSRLPNLLSAMLEETLSQLGMLQLLLLWSMSGLRELVSARVPLLPYTMPMEPSFLLTLLMLKQLRQPSVKLVELSLLLPLA